MEELWVSFAYTGLYFIKELANIFVLAYQWMMHIFAGAPNPNERESVVRWTRTFVPNASDDFTKDWQDGILLCTLMETLIPGSCPRPDLLDRKNRFKNVRRALKTLAKHFDLTQVIEANEIVCRTSSFERKLVEFLMQLKEKVELCPATYTNEEAKLNNQETEQHVEVQPCTAKGTGLAIGYVGRLIKFNVFCSTGNDLDLVVEIKGPSSSCCARITSHSPRRKTSFVKPQTKPRFCQEERSLSFDEAWVDDQIPDNNNQKEILLDYDIQSNRISMGYIPTEPGQHRITVFWHGQHIPGSPYFADVKDVFGKLGESTVTWLKPSIRRKVGLQVMDDVEKEKMGRGKHSVRFQDVQNSNKQLGSVINRKVLRYIVKVGGKDVAVEAESSDMLAPALLKLDYRLDEPFGSRRNSWGFVGDVERKKSLVRQFCVDLDENEDISSHRRSSVQHSYNQETKRLQLDGMSSGTLRTVSEGTRKGFENENEISLDDSQNENDAFSSINDDMPSEIDISKLNGKQHIPGETPPEHIMDADKNNTNTSSVIDEQRMEVQEEIIVKCSAYKMEHTKNLEVGDELTEGKSSSIVEPETDSSISLKKLVTDSDEQINPGRKGICKKTIRIPTLKVNSAKRVSLPKMYRMRQRLSQRQQRKPRKTIKVAENRCIGLVDQQKDQQKNVNEPVFPSQGNNCDAQEQLTNRKKTHDNEKHHSSSKDYDLHYRSSNSEINVESGKSNHRIEVTKHRNRLDPYTVATHPYKDRRRHGHLIRDISNEMCSTESSETHNGHSYVKRRRHRSRCNKPKLFRSSKLWTASEFEEEHRTLDSSMETTDEQCVFKMDTSANHAIIKKNQGMATEPFRYPGSYPDIKCCNSNHKTFSRVSESLPETLFTMETLKDRSDTFKSLHLGKSVKDIIKDFEASSLMHSRNQALRRNNFYSISLNFPPLASNDDRTRVETRIRQWETTSSLPSTPFTNKEAKRLEPEREKLAVLSDVRAKTLFFENIYKEDSSTNDSRSSNLAESRRGHSGYQKLKNLGREKPSPDLVGSDNPAKFLAAVSLENPPNLTNVNRSQSADRWNTGNLRQQKKLNEKIWTNPRVERRYSDPGRRKSNGLEGLDWPLAYLDISRANSFSTLDAVSSSFIFSYDYDDESDDEYIDDEIPDYAAMCLSEYPAEAGHLFEPKHGSKPRAEACTVFGAGIYYGHVAVKNHFKVLTKGAGRGNLSVTLQGSSTHDVANVSVTYVRKDIYHVTYQVMEPGYYLISVRWSDNAVPGSPFVCKATY